MTNNGEHFADGENGSDWSATKGFSELESLRSAEPAPTHEEQTQALLEMQLLQRGELERAGILALAAKLARVDLTNPMVRPSIELHQELQHDNQSIEVTGVQFAVTEVNSAGYEQRSYRHSAVASTFGGVTMPREGFSAEQADAIVGMAGELRQAKANGRLPDLSADLSEVD